MLAHRAQVNIIKKRLLIINKSLITINYTVNSIEAGLLELLDCPLSIIEILRYFYFTSANVQYSIM